MTLLTPVAADLTDPMRAGQVVAYPTEAVFGLGCDPHNESAVQAVAALKGRGLGQGFLVVGASFAHVAPFVDLSRVPSDALARAMATWPGPFTWIFPASARTPAWLTGAHTGVAVRVTAHPAAARVCAAFGGAILSTSANPHGAPPATTAQEVHALFGAGLGAILDAPIGESPKPSTIRDALTGAVLRA